MTTTPHATGTRRLVRRTDDRMIAGVCSGVADYTGVDVTVIRLAAVVGTVLGFGTLLVAYVIAWLLMPQA